LPGLLFDLEDGAFRSNILYPSSGQDWTKQETSRRGCQGSILPGLLFDLEDGSDMILSNEITPNYATILVTTMGT
jgi:hypothetical protein